jgi:hypothetical protein
VIGEPRALAALQRHVPECDQPLKRSTTYVMPELPSVRYGVSICAMLPRQTTFVPGPRA